VDTVNALEALGLRDDVLLPLVFILMSGTSIGR
jgi:hypothetical protein